MYEQREMVCPMCNKHFLGLQALETHISWAHKVKDPKTKVVTDAKGGELSLLNHIFCQKHFSIVCKEIGFHKLYFYYMNHEFMYVFIN